MANSIPLTLKSQENQERSFVFTVGTDFKNSRRITGTLGDFVQQVTTPKGVDMTGEQRMTLPKDETNKAKASNGWISGMLFTHGRTIQNAVGMSYLAIDIDDGKITLDQVKANTEQKNITAIVTTTFNHTPQAPRLRIFVPFSNAITFAPTDDKSARVKAIFWHVSQCLGVADHADINAVDAARIMFKPVVCADEVQNFRAFVHEGEFFDASSVDWVNAPAVTKTTATATTSGKSSSYTERMEFLETARKQHPQMIAGMDDIEDAMTSLHSTIAATHEPEQGYTGDHRLQRIITRAYDLGYNNPDDVARLLDSLPDGHDAGRKWQQYAEQGRNEQMRQLAGLMIRASDRVESQAPDVDDTDSGNETEPDFWDQFDVANVCKDTYNQPRWLVKGLIPLGVPVGLLGKGGEGKGFIALDLCAAVALGKPSCGLGKLERQGVAVYISMEDSAEQLTQRLNAITDGNRGQLNGRLMLIPAGAFPITIGDKKWGELVKQLQRLKPAVIVIDPLSQVTRNVEKNSQEIGTLVGMFQDLVYSIPDCVGVMTMHTKKQDDGTPTGSQAITDSVRLLVQVERASSEDSDIKPRLSVIKENMDHLQLDDAGTFVKVSVNKSNVGVAYGLREVIHVAPPKGSLYGKITAVLNVEKPDWDWIDWPAWFILSEIRAAKDNKLTRSMLRDKNAAPYWITLMDELAASGILKKNGSSNGGVSYRIADPADVQLAVRTVPEGEAVVIAAADVPEFMTKHKRKPPRLPKMKISWATPALDMVNSDSITDDGDPEMKERGAE